MAFQRFPLLFLCSITLSVFIFIFTPLHTFASLSFQQLPEPLVPHAPIQIDIEQGEIILKLRRVDFWDGYVVFVGTGKAKGSSACISRTDFSLQLGNIEYEAANREQTRQGYKIDAPGSGFFIQCIYENEEIVLLPFVAPVNQAAAAIQYENQLYGIPSSLYALKQNSEAAQPTSTFTPTPTRTHTPTATPTFTPAPVEQLDNSSSTYSLPLSSAANSVLRSGSVSNQGIKFTLERIDFWDKLPDDTEPNNDIFIVFTGTLSPIQEGYSTHCISADDVILFIGEQSFEMDDMRSVNQFYQSDFPGYYIPQCATGSSPVTTFFVFDVDVADSRVFLSVHKALLQLDVSISDLAAEASVSLLDVQIIDRMRNRSNTVSPSTHTPAPTEPAVTIGVVNRNANLREGPGTNFDIVGSAAANQTVDIIGSNREGDWLRISDGSWIAAFLVDNVTEVTPTPFPTPVPTISSVFQLNQLPTLIMEPVERVEAVLGLPLAITPFYAGSYTSGYTGAGENRDYSWNGYDFLTYYDSSGILRGIQIVEGLSDKDYKIDEWSRVLALVGISNNFTPNTETLAVVRWNNLNGYFVQIFADGIQSHSRIWSIQIFASE